MENSEVKSVGAEISKKSRSLDLKSIYKSGAVKEGQSKGNSDVREDDDEVRKKKRKSRKRVALSSFEPVGKRSRTSFDEVNVDRLSLGSGDSNLLLSGFSQKLNSSGALNGIPLNLDDKGNVITIPKRRRGTVGRRRFESNRVLNPSGSSSSVDQIAKLNGDERNTDSQQNLTIELKSDSAGKVDIPKVGSSSSIDQVAKLNGEPKGKAKHNQIVELKNDSEGKVDIPKVGSSSSVDEITKLNGERKSKASRKNQSVELKSSSAGKVVDSKVGLSSSVDQIDKLNGVPESKASQQNPIVELKSNSAGKVVNAKVASCSSVDQVAKSNGERKRKNGQQKLSVQLDSNSAGKVAVSKVKRKTGFDESKENRTKAKSVREAKKEGGGHLIVNNGDASSRKIQSSRRKRKNLASGSETVAKKIEPSVDDSVGIRDDFQDDDEENLEENAARMLSSRFDPSCTGFSSKSRTSESPSSNGLTFVGRDFGSQRFNSLDGLDSASGDPANRVLRPRKKYREKGLSRKRRHFYEIRSCDLDPHWVLNRRIKVFWPLDESWYYGLLNDYNPETKLHHVKYDDRDEEWINLQNERFKLLLLPGEVPDTAEPKRYARQHKNAGVERRDTDLTDDTSTESHMDSEPIISWLASSRRLKSSPSRALKKQKTTHLPSNVVSPSRIVDTGEEFDVGLLERESKSCSSSFLPERLAEKSVWESNSSSREIKFPIVYVRRRRKNSEGVGPAIDAREERLSSVNDPRRLKLTMALIESEQFRFELRPLFEYIFGAEIFSLFHSALLVQYGSLVTMWPKVHLEVLFVDNIAGLRFFVFEGCLKNAVAFVFSVLSVFNEPIKQRKCIDLQMPVTSIRFKLSSVRDLKKQQVFEYYRFAKVKRSKWLYLDRKLQPYCLTTNQLPLPECTYDNIKALEDGNKPLHMSSIVSQPSSEVSEKHLVQGIVPIGIPKETSPTSWNSCAKHKIPPPFALSFTAAPTFFLSLHLKLLIEHSIASVSLRDHDSVYSLPEDCTDNEYCSDDARESNQETVTSNGCKDSLSTRIDSNAQIKKLELKDLVSEEFVSLPTRSLVPKKITSPVVPSPGRYSSFDGMRVEIPQFDQVKRNDDGKTDYAEEASDMAWNVSDISPNPTIPGNLWQRNRSTSISSPHVDLSPVLYDGKTNYIQNGFGNGPKKPRTQVQYTSPFGGFDFGSKHRIPNQNGLPYKRIRRPNDKRASDGSRSSRRNLELLACDANVLITDGDRGRREGEARVVLELADHNEWKLSVKISGATKYSHKVHHVLQWSTNRYTHAMMWKGGKDWTLEFPDRGQWVLFKEMHEECFNRNIRAASVKNIPIPGVHLIEESDDSAMEVPFIRNSLKYFRQVETDVEMAMDPERVLYDMDSDDERWVLKNRKSFEDVSDECFERTLDMFEKVAYAKQRDHFTADEMEELVHGVGSIEVIKVIYEHWQQKRQRKGMPLIRQLQPPSWERYQQQLKEWEQSVNKANTATAAAAPVSGFQDKPTPPTIEKPPMFAFCLKPRGLEVPNSRGTKHRSLRRFSVSGSHSHTVPGDNDALQSFGRRLNGFAFGDEKVMYPGNDHDSLDASPLLQPTPRVFSPRDAGPGYLSLSGGGGSEWNHHPKLHRNKSKKITTFLTPPINPQTAPPTYNPRTMMGGKRNGGHRWNMAVPDWPMSHQKYHHHPSEGGGSHRHGIDGSDLDEFRLRDASGAAQHARNMAKLKREKAQRLLYRADLAIHKAVSALMAADAIKATNGESSNANDGRNGT